MKASHSSSSSNSYTSYSQNSTNKTTSNVLRAATIPFRLGKLINSSANVLEDSSSSITNKDQQQETEIKKESVKPNVSKMITDLGSVDFHSIKSKTKAQKNIKTNILKLENENGKKQLSREISSYSSDDTIDLINEAEFYANANDSEIENMKLFLSEPRFHSKEYKLSESRKKSSRLSLNQDLEGHFNKFFHLCLPHSLKYFLKNPQS
jgi:hypothetical protein